MRTSIAIIGAILILAGPAFADAYHWEGGTGDWSDSNWFDQTTDTHNTTPPTPTDTVNIGNWATTGASDVTVDGTYTIAGFEMGNRKDTTVSIATGNSLTVTAGHVYLGSSRTNEARTSILNIAGGDLDLSTLGNVYLSDLNAGDITTVTISSGER